MNRPPKKPKKAEAKDASRRPGPAHSAEDPSAAALAGATGPWKLWPILVVFAAEGTFLSICYALTIRYAPARIVASDVATLPGSAVLLRARLEQDLPPFLGSTHSGRRVTFLPGEGFPAAGDVLPGTGLSTAVGRNGRAEVSLTAPGDEGAYGFRVGLRAPSGVDAEALEMETTFTVHVVPADRRLVVTTARPALAKGEAERPAARELMARLAEDRAVFYLEAVYRPDPEKARTWLREHGFPPGSVLEVPVDPYNSGDVWRTLRAYVEREITPRWDNVDWAIATEVAEYRAFAHSRLRAMLIRPLDAKPADVDDQMIFWARNWKEARTIIENN